MGCINIVAFKKYAKMEKSFMIFPLASLRLCVIFLC